jgi:hypothetical protein
MFQTLRSRRWLFGAAAACSLVVALAVAGRRRAPSDPGYQQLVGTWRRDLPQGIHFLHFADDGTARDVLIATQLDPPRRQSQECRWSLEGKSIAMFTVADSAWVADWIAELHSRLFAAVELMHGEVVSVTADELMLADSQDSQPCLYHRVGDDQLGAAPTWLPPPPRR